MRDNTELGALKVDGILKVAWVEEETGLSKTKLLRFGIRVPAVKGVSAEKWRSHIEDLVKSSPIISGSPEAKRLVSVEELYEVWETIRRLRLEGMEWASIESHARQRGFNKSTVGVYKMLINRLERHSIEVPVALIDCERIAKSLR